jgi:hypothetical protein
MRPSACLRSHRRPRRTAADRERPTAADLLLDGLVAYRRLPDRRSALPEAFAATLRQRSSPKERLRWLWQGCVVALELWDDETAYLLSHNNVRIARQTGTLSELALALSARTPVLVFCGDFPRPRPQSQKQSR